MGISNRPAPIPAHAGIGLRAPHHDVVLAERPHVAWFEVHSENFFGAGSQAQEFLCDIRAHYPVSLHGVGLSLGSAAQLDTAHLRELKQLVDRLEPGLISEHLCWGAIPGRHLNDLLPLPYTEESLELMRDRINETQDLLGRQILIENISSYLTFSHSTIPEWEFLAGLADETGCGLLCDINNIYVNSVNHGFDPRDYIDALPATHIREMHLAGYTEKQDLAVSLLIDTHSRPVADAVWQLYAHAVDRFGNLPTLIEWDADIPDFSVLMDEAAHAERIMHDASQAA